MTSLWSWNSIDLWVSEQDLAREKKEAELFALDTTESEFHFFGMGSRKYNLKGLVIGTTNRDSLETDQINDTARTLTTPWESISSLTIHTIKFTVNPCASYSLGGATYLSSGSPLYNFEAEFHG